MTYEWEQLRLATHSLAGPGSIQQRLAEAYTLHLMHLAPESLPDEARAVFSELRHALTRDGHADNADAIQAVVRSMSDDQASTEIERILALHDALARDGAGF